MININDSPPKLSQDTYEAVLLLPTYLGVEVLRVEAFDPDLTSDLVQNPNNRSSTPQLVYSLVDGNVDFFAVERLTGVVTVVNPNLSKDRYQFNIKVRCHMLYDGAGKVILICSGFHSFRKWYWCIAISTGHSDLALAASCTQHTS